MCTSPPLLLLLLLKLLLSLTALTSPSIASTLPEVPLLLPELAEAVEAGIEEEERTVEVEEDGQACHAPLGLGHGVDRPVAGFSLTASAGEAERARLNGPSAWKPPVSQCNSYLQVNLTRPLVVTGVMTQGDPESDSWVSAFKVAFSADCRTFSTDDVSYLANLVNRGATTRLFHQVALAKCVRIFPVQWQGAGPALRLELLGCDLQVCQEALVDAEQESAEEVRFTSEKIVGGLNISLESAAPDARPQVLYSRACADFTLLSSQEMSQVSHVTMSETVQRYEVSFLRPVRAQCLRLSVPANVTVRSVTAFGCGTVSTGSEQANCGRTRRRLGSRRKRVVGGDPVVAGDWPWLVSLHFLKWHNFTNSSGVRHLCGASLIHPSWVLSAAHCFDEIVYPGLSQPENWRVVVGEHDQSRPDGTEQELRIEKIIKHQQFKIAEATPILHDIALLRLARPAVLSDYVNAVCLDRLDSFPPHSRCVVAGWGQDTVDTPGTKLPYSAVLPLLEPAECRARYLALPEEHMAHSAVQIDNSVLCATAELGGRDACWGDSGGPLFCEKEGRWYQAGVVSIGYRCGDHTYPGIYTRVSHFRSWIEETMASN